MDYSINIRLNYIFNEFLSHSNVIFFLNVDQNIWILDTDGARFLNEMMDSTTDVLLSATALHTIINRNIWGALMLQNIKGHLLKGLAILKQLNRLHGGVVAKRP